MVFFWILISTIIVSLIGLVGIIFFFVKERYLKRILIFLVSFASGVLFGGALYHLFSESLEKIELATSLNLLVFGFVFFFLLEKILYWHHCHRYKCRIHSFTYLTIFGDLIHNFVDGIIIASSFLVSIELGLVTTVLIISHEIPQEIGNFSVLIFGGMEKHKALLYSFLSQFSAILGGILGYLFIPSDYSVCLVSLAAGGFLYISASDLIPKLQEEKDIKRNIGILISFLIGIFLIIMI